LAITIKEMMIIVAIAGLLGAAIWFYHQGRSSEQLIEARDDNAELLAAQKRIQELENEVRQQEHDHSVEMANIDQQYQKELNDGKKRSDSFIDDVMSGRLRLWDKHARCGKDTGSAVSEATTSASVGDGTTGAELSEELERFLELEAGRADEIVIQLTACQAIIRDDRNNAKRNHSR
jgi:hypothetical protein